MRRAAAVVLLALLALLALLGRQAPVSGVAIPQPSAAAQTVRVSPDAVAEAFRAHRSDILLTVDGWVLRTLPDDRNGSRHQRFLFRTATGITVLVAHNIDLAPRLQGLQPGEPLELRGEYVWNPKGGLMHWTHHDPSGRHTAGYILRGGRRYE